MSMYNCRYTRVSKTIPSPLFKIPTDFLSFCILFWDEDENTPFLWVRREQAEAKKHCCVIKSHNNAFYLIQKQ